MTSRGRTARTAALVVDMQNDFGANGGMFDRAGIVSRSPGPRSSRRRESWPACEVQESESCI